LRFYPIQEIALILRHFEVSTLLEILPVHEVAVILRHFPEERVSTLLEILPLVWLVVVGF
jgi:hypothetical protein